MSEQARHETDSRARWFVLAASALGSFAASVMFTSVNVAIPTLVEAFDTKFAVVQWVLLAYLLATSALLPILGRLADMVGKRTIFLGGFALYVVGSLEVRQFGKRARRQSIRGVAVLRGHVRPEVLRYLAGRRFRGTVGMHVVGGPSQYLAGGFEEITVARIDSNRWMGRIRPNRTPIQ
jgi:hypothetical protein